MVSLIKNETVPATAQQTMSAIFALLALFVAPSADAKNLLCSNDGVITREIVDVISSYDPTSHPENVVVQASEDVEFDRAFFFINSSEVGTLHACIEAYGISLESAEYAIETQWGEFLDPPRKKLGRVLSLGSVAHIDGKPVFLQAAAGAELGSLFLLVSNASGGNHNFCFLNESCISEVQEILNGHYNSD